MSSAYFFKIIFFNKSFRIAIRVSNSFDPGQDRRFVGPDLGPNCLQRLSADDKFTASKERDKNHSLQPMSQKAMFVANLDTNLSAIFKISALLGLMVLC